MREYWNKAVSHSACILLVKTTACKELKGKGLLYIGGGLSYGGFQAVSIYYIKLERRKERNRGTGVRGSAAIGIMPVLARGRGEQPCAPRPWQIQHDRAPVSLLHRW